MLAVGVAFWVGVGAIHRVAAVVAVAVAGGVAKVDDQAGGGRPGQLGGFLHRGMGAKGNSLREPNICRLLAGCLQAT